MLSPALGKLKGAPHAWNRLMIRTHTQRKGYPLWIKQPLSINLDTQNACNLKCSYCNVQNSYIEKPEVMPLSTIQHVLNCFKNKKWRCSYVYCYLNGDPILEPRLPKITRMVKETLGVKTVVYTNGSIYENRRLLCDKNLDEVRFTISAATPETYRKVHGKPLFHDALKTVAWLNKNKYPKQRIFVNYILFEENFSELKAWKNLFRKYEQDVRPLHEAYSQTQSIKLGKDGELTGIYYSYASNSDMRTKKYSGYRPCDCFASLTVDVHGNMLHCPTVNPQYHYGSVLENDIEVLWKRKVEVGVNGESCVGCTMKRPDWKELFQKYVWNNPVVTKRTRKRRF